MTVLLDTASTNVFFDDKRLRKEAEDVYQKLVDHCVWIAGRSFDQVWKKTTTETEAHITEAVTSPTSLAFDMILPRLTEGLDSIGQKDEDDIVDEVISDLADRVIPSLRRIFLDQDRIVVILTSVMYYVIGPAFRNRKLYKPETMTRVLDVLNAMSRIPFAHKAWKKEAWDAFLDSRFFMMDLKTSSKWKNIVNSLVSSEKEKFLELFTRIGASPGLFFSNISERALAIRKLAFIIFSGTQDQYVAQLPSVQEKLVETLKTSSSLLHVEVYFCLRILLYKFSSKHLANVWPIIMTELVRPFFNIQI